MALASLFRGCKLLKNEPTPWICSLNLVVFCSKNYSNTIIFIRTEPPCKLSLDMKDIKCITRLPQNDKFGPNFESFDFSWYLENDQGYLRKYVRWIILNSPFERTPVYTIRYSNAMRCVAGWNIFPNSFEGLIVCINPRSFLMRVGQIMHHFSSRVWTHKKRELNSKCIAFFAVLCVYSPELYKAHELILLFICKF
jgi:hypothetical protein